MTSDHKNQLTGPNNGESIRKCSSAIFKQLHALSLSSNRSSQPIETETGVIARSSSGKYQFDDQNEEAFQDKKRLRRRGVDLSRGDLRISSRWSSDEQKSMKNFRDALKEAAQGYSGGTLGRFIKKEKFQKMSDSLRVGTSMMAGLKRTFSDMNLSSVFDRPDSSGGGIADIENTADNNDLRKIPSRSIFRLTSRQKTIRDRYYASPQIQDDRSSLDPGSMDENCNQTMKYRTTPNSDVSTDTQRNATTAQAPSPPTQLFSTIEQLSWDDHLKRDLEQQQQQQQQHRRKKAVDRPEMNSSSTKKDQIQYFIHDQVGIPTPLSLRADKEYHGNPQLSCDNSQAEGSKWSCSSSTLGPSRSFSTGNGPFEERLADIVASGEFRAGF